jgi:hypothetical protein
MNFKARKPLKRFLKAFTQKYGSAFITYGKPCIYLNMITKDEIGVNT